MQELNYDADDAERTTEETPQMQVASSFEAIARALKLMVLILALTILTVGPNAGYVFVYLSQLTQEQKVASEMAITLVKTAIATLLIPNVARRVVDLIVIHRVLTFDRFRLRMAIATALSATTTTVLPVPIVLVTDPRCLYDKFQISSAARCYHGFTVPVLLGYRSRYWYMYGIYFSHSHECLHA